MDAGRIAARDEQMMRRAIALGRDGGRRELPFACVVCRDDEVIAEATNAVRQDRDVTRHAEIVAMAQARRVLGRRSLAGCTLYTTVEPCAMCSFALRESRVGRVVFGLRSPLMGGHSKWSILSDPELSRAMPEVFGPPPEVRSDLLAGEVERSWFGWNPLIWTIIRMRGCFTVHHGGASPAVARPRRRMLRALFPGF
ncbi:hypothetical protein CCR97_15370 [Rhodoplanes elegans]|uniref:CMP/dCMP-type deaminase domain-containing protein n=1 Tax=Rhodoplanes elegans TaxID=29408 RepID=A0A327KKG8_9BRAD|nr:nucleoside deaminase [Rhodoplanes elegans]MBK5959574.1 hypothetical protein [Rhodoplanes elegans]RAI39229.1 hypothetical protein CH338_10155 [Rhodoplanes elegans]